MRKSIPCTALLLALALFVAPAGFANQCHAVEPVTIPEPRETYIQNSTSIEARVHTHDSARRRNAAVVNAAAENNNKTESESVNPFLAILGTIGLLTGFYAVIFGLAFAVEGVKLALKRLINKRFLKKDDIHPKQ